jgi:hypothetical protein
MWGEDRQVIRTDYLKQGFPGGQVDRALDAAVKERQAHFRKAGFGDVLTGIGACFGFAGAFILYYVFFRDGFPGFNIIALLFAAMIFLPLAAIFFFVRGVRRIQRGGKEERAATDVDDF